MANKRNDFIDRLVQEVEKKYGDGIIIRASEASGLKIKKFSTGIVSLDVALLGGWAEGRIHQIAGKYSTCKTTSAYAAARQFQRLYPEDGFVMLVSAEKEVDTTWAKFNGVDLRRMVIVLPEYGERGADIILKAVDSAYEGEVRLLVIVDSLSQMVPVNTVCASSLEQNHMGKFPQFVSKMYAVLTAKMRVPLKDESGGRVTVIVLNQLRATMKMFGEQESAPGGNAKDNLSSQIVYFNPGERIVQQIGSKSLVIVKDQVATGVKFYVKKNKCQGPQSTTGQFVYFNRDYRGQQAGSFDNVEQMVTLGQVYDIVSVRRGNSGTEVVLSFDKTKSFSSLRAFQQALRDDDGLYVATYEALLNEASERYWSRKVVGDVVADGNEIDSFEASGEESDWFATSGE